MTTIRVAKRQRFTTIDRRAVNDDRLSFRARGILVWLLDKPDDWRCNSDTIARAGGEGREAVRTALRELEEHGYLIRNKRRDERGQWVSEATVLENPTDRDGAITVSDDGFPGDGFPGVGFPGAKTEDCVPKTDTEQTNASGKLALAPSVPSGRQHHRYSDDFERWWLRYPKKRDKLAASKAFAVAARTVPVDHLVASAEAWANHWQAEATEDRYIIDPERWLKRGRYEEPPPVPQRKLSSAEAALARIQARRATEPIDTTASLNPRRLTL